MSMYKNAFFYIVRLGDKDGQINTWHYIAVVILRTVFIEIVN